jgi:hypothetical protein
MSITYAEHHGSAPFLRPSEASLWLARFGVNAAPATLAKYRVTGQGPIFCKIGRRVVYTPTALGDWAEQRISPPKTSTSAP